MTQILVGASVKEFDRLADYYSRFDVLEIDLNTAKEYKFIRMLQDYKDKVYSVHLSNHSMAAAVNSLDYVKRCGGKVAVFHPEYPRNFEQLMQDLEVINRFSRRKRIPVIIENLCDRKRKSGEYDGARNPITICTALEELDNPRLGLCLDTGHAVSNEMKKWHDPLVFKWLKHMHVSDTVVGKDLHLPFSITTNWRLKVGVRRILKHRRKDVVVMLENKTLNDTIKSYNYFGRKLSTKHCKKISY